MEYLVDSPRGFEHLALVDPTSIMCLVWLAQSSFTLLIFSLSSLGTRTLTTDIDDRTNRIQTLTLPATKSRELTLAQLWSATPCRFSDSLLNNL